MSILRKIKCDVKGCPSYYTERGENLGFPGWGHINGVHEKLENGQIRETAHICPKCRKKIILFLNGEL